MPDRRQHFLGVLAQPRLSEGKCDLDDVEGVIARVVDVAVMALSGAPSSKAAPRAAASVSLRGVNQGV